MPNQNTTDTNNACILVTGDAQYGVREPLLECLAELKLVPSTIMVMKLRNDDDTLEKAVHQILADTGLDESVRVITDTPNWQAFKDAQVQNGITNAGNGAGFELAKKMVRAADAVIIVEHRKPEGSTPNRLCRHFLDLADQIGIPRLIVSTKRPESNLAEYKEGENPFATK